MSRTSDSHGPPSNPSNLSMGGQADGRDPRGTLSGLLSAPGSAASVPLGEVPGLLGCLAALQSVLLARLLASGNERGEAGASGDGEPAAPELLPVPTVARILNVPPSYVYELARRGDLPAVRFGRYVRVARPDLEDWVSRHRGSGG